MQIRAAVARSPHAPLSLETLELAPPRDGEILVHVVATGVCHTDIVMRDQMYPVPQPIVLGHEGAGIVAQIGAHVRKVTPGDHVLMSYNSCGECGNCLAGATSYCLDFFARNFAGARTDQSTPLSVAGAAIHGNFFGQSSFATFAICTERNVVKVPRDAPLEKLGPLACGVQTGAGAAINGLHVSLGSSFAVFGCGTVGLSAVLGARLVGAGTIIAIDLVESRLALAREFGATHTIHAGAADAVKTILEVTGTGCNFALDTTGLPKVIRQAVDSLAPRGACAILGASPAGAEVSLDLIHLMSGGRSIRGTVEGDSSPDVFIPKLISLYLEGRFPFDRMLKFYALDQINEAIADSEAGKTIKPVIRMPQP
jgi:aryl-alcohol dehydrogenase